MQLFNSIRHWWQSLSIFKETTAIKCPYCGEFVSVSYSDLRGRHYFAGKIHIVAPGTIIPCPKCGKNLADYLRSGKITTPTR